MQGALAGCVLSVRDGAVADPLHVTCVMQGLADVRVLPRQLLCYEGVAGRRVLVRRVGAHERKKLVTA